MADSEMVVRVGKVLASELAKAWGAELQPDNSWSVTFKEDASFEIDGYALATAAISAMRKPPKGMEEDTLPWSEWIEALAPNPPADGRGHDAGENA